MNSVQLTIIAIVVILILGVIGYYWYQEAKFKRMVENTFNLRSDDVLMGGNKTLVFEGDNKKTNTIPKATILQKDVSPENDKSRTNTLDPLLGGIDIMENSPAINNIFAMDNKSHDDKKSEAKIPENANQSNVVNLSKSLDGNLKPEKVAEPIPADSAEAFFVKLDNLNFPFGSGYASGLDFIVDIVFEENKKLKILPEITQFTHKPFVFYVLDKDDCWHKFEKGKKYVAAALKLVVQLVDQDGIISQAQVSNIYNELHRFVVSNQAHIRASDYEIDIEHIRQEMAKLSDIELELELYLLVKGSINYSELAQFLKSNNFSENSGTFNYIVADRVTFAITAEHGAAIERGNSYKLLSITAKLHLHEDPLTVVDMIFDFAEQFMQQFESRVLTANKLILEQKDYDSLVKYIKDYVADAKKNNIQLGGELLRRIY